MLSWPGIRGEKINFAGPLPEAVLSITRTVTVLFEEGILRSGGGFGVATKSAEAMTSGIARGIVDRPGSRLTDLLFEGSRLGYMGYSVIEVPEGKSNIPLICQHEDLWSLTRFSNCGQMRGNDWWSNARTY
jgi:hypothetical protein